MTSSQPWAYRAAVAAVVVGLLGASASAVHAVVARQAHQAPAPVATSQPVAPSASTVVAADASMPPATAQPAATTSSAPEPEPEKEPRAPPPPWQRFKPRVAREALNALAPTLTDCKIASGRSGKVEVVFEPDGHVSSAKPLEVYVGTFGGKCVAKHLKKATVPPFAGKATAYTYVFVIPD
jgi:hypothetical protein